MRVAQQPAYVLHRHDYAETSLLVEAFTRDHGRVGLVAKGARRERSPLRALLAPFQPLLLDWTGRGELATLTAGEAAGAAALTAGDSLYCGFYINELLLRLLQRHDPHDRLFDQYCQVLSRLSADPIPDAALRMFEKHLLIELGYGLSLGFEAVSGQPIAAGRRYTYVPDRGAVPAGADDREGVDISGAALLDLETGRFRDARSLRDAKRLLRSALAPHLGDRPLHSRALFRLVRPAPAADNEEKPC